MRKPIDYIYHFRYRVSGKNKTEIRTDALFHKGIFIAEIGLSNDTSLDFDEAVTKRLVECANALHCIKDVDAFVRKAKSLIEKEEKETK